VLGADGKPRPGIVWTARSQQDWLEAEGVRFFNGAADPKRPARTLARNPASPSWSPR
jgi:hypothetical protein